MAVAVAVPVVATAGALCDRSAADTIEMSSLLAAATVEACCGVGGSTMIAVCSEEGTAKGGVEVVVTAVVVVVMSVSGGTAVWLLALVVVVGIGSGGTEGGAAAVADIALDMDSVEAADSTVCLAAACSSSVAKLGDAKALVVAVEAPDPVGCCCCCCCSCMENALEAGGLIVKDVVAAIGDVAGEGA